MAVADGESRYRNCSLLCPTLHPSHNIHKRKALEKKKCFHRFKTSVVLKTSAAARSRKSSPALYILVWGNL